MRSLALVGSAGIGLVWGWLLGSVEGRIRMPRRTVPVLVLASLAVASIIWLFVEWRGTLCFGIAGLLAYLIHAGWRRHLRRRLEPINPT